MGDAAGAGSALMFSGIAVWFATHQSYRRLEAYTGKASHRFYEAQCLPVSYLRMYPRKQMYVRMYACRL